MGYRTILSSPVTFKVMNTSGDRIVVSGGNLAPGKYREIAASVFANNKFRAEELAELARRNQIQVTINGNGYVNWALDVADLTALAATGVFPTTVKAMATVDLPAVTDVPVGTVIFDTTLAALVTNDGAAWV